LNLKAPAYWGLFFGTIMIEKLRKQDIVLALLFIASLCAYVLLMQHALVGPFFFDDFPNLQHLALLQDNFSVNWGKYLVAFEGSPGRPIAALSFLINDNAWPSDPYSFKLTNVLIHLLNGVLVFGFLRQLAKTSSQLPQHFIWPLLAMLAWLFHPLQISTQMLVVQRMTLLSATFSIAGLWAYLYLLQHSLSWRGTFGAMAALGIATLLAFLCKENGALLPIYALVLNLTLLHSSIAAKDSASRRLIAWSCILPSIAVVAIILYFGLQPNVYSGREFTLFERLLTQCHVVFDYLKEIVFPSLTGSGIYHDDFPITKSLFAPISTFLIGIAFIGSIIWAVLKRESHAIASFAILWFFAGHLMESTVIPLELYFEHRNYLPLLGIAMAVTAIPFYLVEYKQIGFFFLSIWLCILVAITALQAPVWGNIAMLSNFWITEHPKSLRATHQLAKFYFDTADPQESVNIMMYAYENGVNSADLPLTSLLTSCWRPGVDYSESLLALSNKAFQSSPFSNGSLVVLQTLNNEVRNDTCPDVINRQQWWTLSDAMLANIKFKRANESFIRVERAKLRMTEKNLNGAMHEFELAYSANPTIELSQKMAEVLLSAGLTDEATIWLNRGLKIKQPFFEVLLYDQKIYSRQLLQAIEKYKSTQNTTASIDSL
jgi:hypothetical protein